MGPETALLPNDWLQRVHRVQNGNTNHRVGYCLDVKDLFMAKAAAGREKDREFCAALFTHGYVVLEDVLKLVPLMPLDAAAQRRLRSTIRRWCTGGQGAA